MTTSNRAKRRPPLSIRLNDGELARLKQLAGTTPLSTYIKSRALGGTSGSPTGRALGADRGLLAQVLGQLGASGLSVSMKRLADAAESGSLYVDARTASELRQACGCIDEMHTTLLAAVHGRSKPKPPTRLDELFNSLNADWGSGQ